MNIENTRYFTGQERKRRFHSALREAGKLQKKGRRGLRTYAYNDSKLQKEWNPFQKSFQATFGRCLPEGERGLKEYLEKVLRHRKGEAVGIEFGGPGSKLFAGFSTGFFKRSLGVTLVDWRKRRSQIAADDDRGHSVIAGNVLTAETNEHVSEWLSGAKADVIFERMARGLEKIPSDPHVMSKTLNSWYAMLNDDGVMFLQVPISMRPLMREWLQLVRDTHPNELEIQYHEGSRYMRDGDASWVPVLRIRKLANSPEELPMLNSRTALRTPARDIGLS